MINLENINKVVERIKKSNRFDENWISNTVYHFDDSLIIERYNGLYRIDFRGFTLGHLHNKGKDKNLHDIIYNAIDEKKKYLKDKALEQL